MTDESEVVVGRWHVPEGSGPAIHGLMTFSPGTGVELDLDETLPDIPEWVAYDPPLLIGDTTAGPVTLVGCREAGFKQRDDDSLRPQYRAEIAYVGEHFDQLEDISFDQTVASVSWLGAWLFSVSGIHRVAGQVRYAEPEPVVLLREPEIRLRVSGRRGHRRHGYTLEEYPTVEVSFSERTHVDVHLAALRTFRSFLMFITGKPSRVERFDGLRRPLTDGHGYVRTLFQREEATDHWPLVPGVLLPFHAHEDNIESLYTRWVELWDEIGTILELHTGVLAADVRAPRFRFIAFAQALEAFHRLCVRRRDVPKDEHRARRARVKEALAPEEWRYVEPRLTNEVTFVERVLEMANQFPELSDLFGYESDTFASKCRDTRNWLTHLDGPRGSLFEGRALGVSAEALRSLLEGTILVQLGLSREAAAGRVCESLRMRFGPMSGYL